MFSLRKVLSIILTIALVGTLSYGLMQYPTEFALAEDGIEATEVDSAEQTPEAPVVDETEYIADETGASFVEEAETEAVLLEEVPEEELPYWQTDSIYQDLIGAYDTAVHAGCITTANIKLTGASVSGLAGEIQLGDSTQIVVSSGTNAPHYDNLAGTHLTPREGYPQAGSVSDRSFLSLVEERDGTIVYEATFFFGSLSWPDAPFTAFSTFLVVELERIDSNEEKSESVGESSDRIFSETVVRRPFSHYVNHFWNAYHSGNHDTYVTAANFKVSEVLSDGTVKGTVGSQSITITGTSGDAQALTDTLPNVGQTSTAALLTFNGSNYDALFLFGDVFDGSTEGSAIGGFTVSLDLGTKLVSDFPVTASALRMTSSLSLFGAGVSTFSVNANDLYVGYQFVGTFSGNYWYWNNIYYGAVFGMTVYWEGKLIDVYMDCLEPMVYGPDSINYAGSPVYGTVTGIDRMAGTVNVSLWTTGPASYYQDLSATATVPFSFTGSMNLVKSSSVPTITDGNDCYSLAGAQYGLYRSWSDANSDTNRVYTFTTDRNGASNTARDLNNGYYYLRELIAPQGYSLNATIYAVTHNTTHTYFSVSDAPYYDPVLTVVQKLDATTGAAYGKDDPNGFLLADGEFTVRYWDGYYDTIEEAEAAGEPTRTWIIKTRKDGRAVLHENFLAAGSDTLYTNAFGDAIIPLGTVAIQETKAPPGYLLPDPNTVNLQQITETGILQDPITRLNEVTVMEIPHEVTLEKLESDTNNPVPNTEFTLYKESTLGAGDWTEVSSHVTDENGKCVFSPVAIGSYKLDETLPNPLYAELEESGDGAHYFEVTELSTGEAQVFKNELIEISISVYKKTIPLTNTALDGTKDQYRSIVGYERYYYNFGARSTSNVRVDEFVITDSLEYVTSKGYRMESLWTGTAPVGMDYDGLMHILYKTNLTDLSEQVVFAYNPMSANPYNANNLGNNMSVSIEPGWRIWQECVSTTSAIRLDVADLNLQNGEYIIGIRAVYGGVVKGFYTGTGWDISDNPQSFTGDRAVISTLSEDIGTFAYADFELRDWYYSVVATASLLPVNEMGDETVMEGSIRADLFRNWGIDSPVLTDIAKDKVETRVIKTFSFEKENLGIKFGNYSGSLFGFPVTGDSQKFLIALAALLAIGGFVLLVIAFGKHKTSKSKDR